MTLNFTNFANISAEKLGKPGKFKKKLTRHLFEHLKFIIFSLRIFRFSSISPQFFSVKTGKITEVLKH